MNIKYSIWVFFKYLTQPRNKCNMIFFQNDKYHLSNEEVSKNFWKCTQI